ncbi:tRNA-intron lyase [Candidatus Marsarchaeota archaeon]|nr:tRNA-intron lyase [Candidatus Marsarchaeota archaeon]
MISLGFSKGMITATDQSTIDVLRRGYFGKMHGTEMQLDPEEALYLIDVRNAQCSSQKGGISFNELASRFCRSGKFIARYFTYKDWRERGLVALRPFNLTVKATIAAKQYPGSSLRLPKISVNGLFFKSDLMTIIDDAEHGREIYDRFWFGQYGSYKAADRGRLNKLDTYETIFLISKGILNLENSDRAEVTKLASSRRGDFGKLYGVYKDWRERGYVIKTGFKFGTHFRAYFPGAHPVIQGEGEKSWHHSKHVIHVFPKESKLLISEWARAIRVAHSVRKTFILAVPGILSGKKTNIDFVLYHRKGSNAENPDTDMPKYAMLSLSEEETIGGSEFASAIRAANDMGLSLVIAIADRETAVTYYKVRQIALQKSRNEYYEIEWMQP